jgi:hypothetical protein
MGSVLACYRALGHGGWTPPSLGFLFGAAVLLLVDLFRVPLVASPPAQAAGWRGWAWTGRGALWVAAGVAVASVTHMFWGAAEKAFIYFRF